jgi:two-component system response regulator AtoC
LSQSQHYVQVFKSGDELLAAVEQGLPALPDLILLDHNIPGRTGIEILGALHIKAKDSVVIILTAYGIVEEVVEAMKLGAYDFINKTVDLQLVESVVNQALEYLSLRRQAWSVEKSSGCLK